ncbi:MAG: hypothetical protein WDN26_04470 [Chitinophagaceae bacterium]
MPDFLQNPQKIIYSEPDRNDTRRMNIEIVGKVGGNFHVYKNYNNKNYIAVLDNEMAANGEGGAGLPAR